MASSDRFDRIATNDSRYSYATAYNGNTKVLSGRAPRGAQVPVYIDGNLNGTATADESGNWSLVLGGTINPGQFIKVGNAVGNGINQRNFTIPFAPALGALSLSAYAPFARVPTPVVGQYFAARVTGGNGGIISLSGAGSAGLSVSQNYIVSGYPTALGPVNLVETLGTASNSPRTTNSVTTVTDGGVIPVTPPPEPAILSTLDVDEWSWSGRTAALVTNPTAGSTSQVLSSTDNWASMGARGSELRFEKAPSAAGTTRQVTIRTSKDGQFVDKTHTFTSRKTWPKPLRARPSALNKALLWQDAAGTVPVVNDGDPIGRLVDPISGWVWTQTTAAARPLYRTNGPGGKPAMRFDGAQFLEAETSASIGWLNDGFNAKKFTVNIVGQCDFIPGALAVMAGWGNATAFNHTIGVNSNAAIQTQFANGGTVTTNGTLSMVTAGTPFMISENANGARSKPCVALVRDGLFDLKPASGNDLIEVGSAAFGTFSATRMLIGRAPGNTPYWFTGFITEIAFFDGDVGIVTSNYMQKRINEAVGLTTIQNLPFVASDPSKWEAWRFDDFDATSLNAQLTPLGTDTMPTGWVPGYVSQGGGRQIFGSGGALEAEVQLFGDTRNPIVNQTPPARVDDSKLKIEPILLPSQLKQGTYALTGQITTLDTSTAVTGVGTKFTTEIALATLLHDDQGRYLGYVNAINSDTSLTLLANATFSVTNVPFKKVGLAASVGTVSTTAGSNIVTAGSGADFVNRFRKGYLMFAQDGSLIGEVDTVTTTQITLKAPAPTTFSGVRVARAYSHLSFAQTSMGFLNRQYGKIEIRAKMGGSIPGDFGALWMMPTAYVWPGEIDIHEQFGLHGSSSRHTSLHTDPYRPISAGAANKIVTATSVNTDPLDEEYHLIGVEWDETGVVCTLDGYRLSPVRLVDGIRNAAIVNAGDGSAPNGTRTLNVLGGTSDGSGASISVTSSGGVATAVSVTKSGRWYGPGYILKETDGSDVKYGQSFTVDYGPDTAIPSQFHGPFYMLINQALGSIGGALVEGDPLPKMEVDYVRWQKPKRTPPAKLTVGNTPSFDTAVENAAAAIINGHSSRGSNLSTAEQAAVRYFVRQFMAWELRNDVRETNMPPLWDNTKRSLWDARDAIYFPAFGRTRAASKINWKDPTKELSEVGSGIGWTQGRGLSLPGTAGVYLSGGPLITDTQFNQYDNGFGLFLTQAPTNTTLGTAIAFDASHRFDVASNEFDQRMCHSAGVTGFISRSQPVTKGMYVATRGHRPEEHTFKDGELVWGGYISSDAVATRAGSLKIGSRDGTTAGAAFEFAYTWAGRRALQEETERETAILNSTMQMAGFSI